MRTSTLVMIGWLLMTGLALAQQPPPVDPGTTGPAWSPYLAGSLIGVLAWFTFYFSGRPIGASGAYIKVSGKIGEEIAPEHTGSLPYFEHKPPKIDWEVMLVLSVIFGAFLAAWTGGEITARWLPPFWVENFGEALWPRLLVGFIGGVLLSIGARIAGGCTSGHGISGTLQLSVGSWVALISFFVGGVITAMLFYSA